jgi:hypothetical protein
MFSHLNNPIYGVLIDSIINSYLIAHCSYNPSSSTSSTSASSPTPTATTSAPATTQECSKSG